MKVFITKHALTAGIEEVEAEICSNVNAGMICVGKRGWTCSKYFHGEGRQWHRTRESAIKKAVEIRDSRIRSLKKQIQELETKLFV